ncbi:hypothetical protein A4A49_65316 [Nicotiana attenuata]|uniref:DUF4283 domain-containing protein n=1 Tax=Nicotiana attenuata TaxID=49451 RepID=A0A1J6IK59_NICAT|nr:hypothetical protein A4A49_65316 [Nicotiana attenuata]
MEVGQSSPNHKPLPQTSTNPNPIQNYAKLLHPQAINAPMHVNSVNLKPVELLHGEPMVRWKTLEVKQSIMQQGLHLEGLGKFSYGKPAIQELRKAIPIQCELKGSCSVGLIEDSHVLIKLSLMEDYIHLLSKPAF